MSAAFFLPAIARQQKRYEDILLAAGAICAETAVFPEKVGITVNQAFRNMIWRGRVVRLQDGACYLPNRKNERRQ